MPTRHRAAAALVVLTPLIAEMAFGVTPLKYFYLVLLWLPIYGAGVLLIRELVHHTGRGWPSILLLGVAYELMEDGPGLQALSSPHLYDAADWGIRLFGLNVTYWLANVIYHVIFSVTIPILVTDLLFPAHRDHAYLGRKGMVATGVVWLLGVGILRIAVPPSEDPGYTAPLPVLIGCVVAVLGLAWVALRVLPAVRKPARWQRRSEPGAVPSIAVLVAIGLVGSLVLLFLTFPINGSDQPAYTEGRWVLVPMALAVVLVVAGYRMLVGWTGRAGWSDRHALALAAGALVGHSLAGSFNVYSEVDRFGLLIIAALTAHLTLRLDRRLRTR